MDRHQIDLSGPDARSALRDNFRAKFSDRSSATDLDQEIGRRAVNRYRPPAHQSGRPNICAIALISALRPGSGAGAVSIFFSFSSSVTLGSGLKGVPYLPSK